MEAVSGVKMAYHIQHVCLSAFSFTTKASADVSDGNLNPVHLYDYSMALHHQNHPQQTTWNGRALDDTSKATSITRHTRASFRCSISILTRKRYNGLKLESSNRRNACFSRGASPKRHCNAVYEIHFCIQNPNAYRTCVWPGGSTKTGTSGPYENHFWNWTQNTSSTYVLARWFSKNNLDGIIWEPLLELNLNSRDIAWVPVFKGSCSYQFEIRMPAITLD